MGKRREKHLCPPQIFGFFPFPVQGFKARIGLRGILSSVLSPLLRRGERKKTHSETSSQPASNFDYCSAKDAKVGAEGRRGGFLLCGLCEKILRVLCV